MDLKNIKHNPIVEATIQLNCRFHMPLDIVIGVLFTSLQEKYPNMQLKKTPVFNIPENIRTSDPELRNKPTHIFECESGSILIGENTIAISINLPYISWEQSSAFIYEIIDVLTSLNIVKKYHNVSIRYLDFFKFNIFQHINLEIIFNNNNINHYPSTIFRTEFPSNEFMDILQITNGVHLQNNLMKINDDGSLIDTIVSKVLSDNEDIKQVIESEHQESHNLFSSLLKSDCLELL